MKTLFRIGLGLTLLGFTYSVTSQFERKDKYVSLYNSNINKVVTIYNQDRVGSGALVSARGHILTCEHVVAKARLVNIALHSGEVVAGEVLYSDAKRDIALLKIYQPKITPYVKVASPRSIRIGQEVCIIGSPFEFAGSLSGGLISNLYIDLPRKYNITFLDARANPGNSGAPLLNMKGELVGLVQGIYNESPGMAPGLSIAVSCEQAYEVLGKFKGLWR